MVPSMVAPERYQLLGPLGTGGMAEVLLAKTRGPNGFERLLAVKRILPERAKDPDAVRMLVDEARNAAGLSHHRIVQVLDIELRDGVVLYAMEYLHGQTLEALLGKARRLPLDASLAICIAVADGLHHAHERSSPIIHRDVAPSNVMVLYDGNIKLIDFGIAKAANNLSNTVFGTFKGRLGYSSPEQVRCEAVDRRTDVYSLAVMLYELTTGRPAFSAHDEPHMLDLMEKARITPPRELDAQYPAELEAIVMKGLARDRNARYATAAAMQLDLEAFARRADLSLTDLTISRLMAKLFATELEPWHRARNGGMTLEDHVIQATLRTLPPSTHDSIEERATQPRVARRRRRRRNRMVIGIAVVVALFAAAYLFTRWVLVDPPSLKAASPSG
ncbi:MAG TPA: serine/threonine-protein kinase [Kofleriaceae bacterium]|nr:serine/threonine-protein kinase [Kofleriaceae bacterium]